MIQSDVEPNRRVERAILVQTERRQFIVEPLRIGRRGKITVVPAPIGDRAGNSVDQLANGVLAVSRRWAPIAAGYVAVKVLADDNVAGELAPRTRNLTTCLLEDNPAALVFDRGRAQLPVDEFERLAPSVLKTRGTPCPASPPRDLSRRSTRPLAGPTAPGRLYAR